MGAWNAIAVGTAEDMVRTADMLERLDAVAPLGECRLKASEFCTHLAVMERLDPMAMAPENPAPNETLPTCAECFEARSDEFLKASAR